MQITFQKHIKEMEKIIEGGNDWEKGILCLNVEEIFKDALTRNEKVSSGIDNVYECTCKMHLWIYLMILLRCYDIRV